MKLLVVAALVGICTAGRLENLERSYLPPENGINFNQNQFSSGLGSTFTQQQRHPQNSFAGPSNQYLQPINNPGFSNSRNVPAEQQYSIPSTSYGIPQRPSSNIGQGPVNRQSLAPSSSQNIPAGAPSRQYLTPNTGSQSDIQKFGGGNQQQFGSATNRQYITPGTTGIQKSGLQQFGGSTAGQQQRYGSALNRQYLTPSTSNSQNNGHQQFTSAKTFQQSQFGSTPSRQYLSPLSSDSQSSGLLNFGNSQFNQRPTISNPDSQYFAPSIADTQRNLQQQSVGRQNYGARISNGPPRFDGTRFPSMLSKTKSEPKRLYLAPKTNSFDNVPEQRFDDRTGYEY